MNAARNLKRPVLVQLSALTLMAVAIVLCLPYLFFGTAAYGLFSLVMIFFAGVSLLIRHKFSWMLGVISCTLFAVLAGYDILQGGSFRNDFFGFILQVTVLFFVVFVVVMTLLFFRYPYLDRRQNWLSPTANRYEVSIEALVNGVSYTVKDISYTGVQLRVSSAGAFEVGEVLVLQFPDISDLTCKGRVIRAEGEALHLEFVEMAPQDENMLLEWLKSRNFALV